MQAAVTDHITFTEAIFFNSLPWRATEHSGRGWKARQLTILPKAQVFPLSAICRAPSVRTQGLHAALQGALVGSSSLVLSPASSLDSQLTSHINIYVPQIKPDPTAVCSDKFIIRLKREEGQQQQEDTHVNAQTDSTPSAQPHSKMVQEFKEHPLLCTYCKAHVQGVNQIQSQWNLHIFLQCYQ